MKRLMRRHQRYVVSIKQPIDVFAIERQECLALSRPTKFFLGQGFVVQDKAIAIPKQTLYFIASTIGEGVECTAEGVVPQLLLNDGRQTPAGFAKVYRVTIQINTRQRLGGAQGTGHDRASTRAINAFEGVVTPWIRMPLGSSTITGVGGGVATTCTGTKGVLAAGAIGGA